VLSALKRTIEFRSSINARASRKYLCDYRKNTRPTDGQYFQALGCAIRKSAALDDFRIHDIRHSFASIAAEGGAFLLHIGKLIRA
jgi:integrase